MIGEKSSDFCHERRREIFELLLADAGKLAELHGRSRKRFCHVAQRYVRENDVSGDIALISESAAQRAQIFEGNIRKVFKRFPATL
jgi:hypothetical protein